MKKSLKTWTRILGLVVLVFSLSACGMDSGLDIFSDGSDGAGTLRVVSGSENEEFEHIIEEYNKTSDYKVSIDYMGSLDIMRLLQSGNLDYDALWPASSIWLSLGDDHRLLKHQEPIATSPIAFGIKESLAKDLGLDRGEVYTRDIIAAIEEDGLSFAMTSATQSNSGASAYLGFLSALQDDEILSLEDLEDPRLKRDIQSLLSGVNRSSGSSNWLVDLFLSGDYDAMVNYEALIIKTNELLEEESKEPLTLVYPVDGLAISDSPLAYVEDQASPNPDKEEAFLDFQSYMLSDEVQSQIEKTGRRSALGTVREENEEIFEKWNIDLDRVLNTIRFPEKDVIFQALDLYQEDFKKPAYTVYVLDYSGSMSGEGKAQLEDALGQVLIQENARQNLLQASSDDETVIMAFHSETEQADRAHGNGKDLEDMYYKVKEDYQIGSGTHLFEAVDEAMAYLKREEDHLGDYIPAIVVLTDGHANGPMGLEEFRARYDQYGMDIPIFSILFADANPDEMEDLAQMSNARVFDGREDLVEAFRSVKGYN